MHENVLKTNVEKNDTANKIRIELEYLLLSWAHKNAIYISTIPDKYQHYYSSNRLPDTLINACDFSTFHFGKVAADGESITFSSGNGIKTVIWDIRPFIGNLEPKKIYIREIAVQKNDNLVNVVLVNKALEEPISFTRQKKFLIVFNRPGFKQDISYDSLHMCGLLDSKIYFQPFNHGYNVFFRFNENLDESNDSAIRFDYKRVRYSPLALMSTDH